MLPGAGRLAAVVLTVVALVACAEPTTPGADDGATTRPPGLADGPTSPEPAATAAPSPGIGSGPRGSPGADESIPEPGATPRPGTGAAISRPQWLGTRVLPTRADGYGRMRPTPPELRNRRLPPPSDGPDLPPPGGQRFASSVQRVPADVRDRSTWDPDCPVGLDDLRYVLVTFHGFDDRPHTGELLVHRRAAAPLVEVFERLYRARFPIERMAVVRPEELDAPPTGDGNNTTAFVCRPVTGGEGWSQHAYGLAIDINPFHNPYVRDDVVLPELAGAYTDRDWERPGMILPDGPVVAAFDAIGWGWGGRWNTLRDWQHFSATGN